MRQARLARDRARVARPGGAEDADVVLAVAVPIADDRQVPLLAEFELLIGSGPSPVAVAVQVPDAVAEDADVVDAVAVPVAGYWLVIACAIAEDVVALVDDVMTCPMDGTIMCPPSATSSPERQGKHGSAADVEQATFLPAPLPDLTMPAFSTLFQRGSVSSIVPLSISSSSVLRI